jgi:elongation factor P
VAVILCPTRAAARAQSGVRPAGVATPARFAVPCAPAGRLTLEMEASEIKRGTLLDLDGTPWLVIEVSTQTPSARGGNTITRVKARNLKTGQLQSRQFRAGEQVEEASCEHRPTQFLYRDGEDHLFMDQESYDQFSLDAEQLGDTAGYLTEGLVVRALLYREEVISIELPNTVDLEVVETVPTIKGATATAQPKPATLSTGLQVMVPPYLSVGDMIRIDTRTGRFVERIRG